MACRTFAKYFVALLRHLKSMLSYCCRVFRFVYHIVPFMGIPGVVVKLFGAILVLNESISLRDDGIVAGAKACSCHVRPLASTSFRSGEKDK